MIAKLKNLLKDNTQLIFDFDRTIAKMDIDWSDWHIGVSSIYSKFNPDHGYQEGKHPHTYFNDLAKTYGESLIEEARLFNSEYERKHTRGFVPYNELVSLIKNQSGRKMYIYSSNSYETVEKGLRELDIFDLFHKIISRSNVSLLKPASEGFSLIDDFEKDKNRFIMIGDSSSDQGAAAEAGIEFLKCDYFESYEF